jgi:diguanylate cyclase (GGDEF)-like protein/PAS domain S-box-containing protein
MVLKLRDFRLLVEHASDAIMVTEAAPYCAPGPKIVYVNQAFCQLCGYEKSEILGRNPRFLQGPQTDKAMLQDIRTGLERARPLRLQLLNYHKTGRSYWVEMSIMPLHDDSGRVSHFVAIERDVSHWHSVQDALYLLAVTDELTSLFNRRMFVELGNKYLHLAHRQETPLSVVMLDLDYFKQVNDRFGHQMGDSLLRVVGRVLSQGIRESDVAGRLGGEEFGVLLPETSQQEALQVLHRLRGMLHGACREADFPPAACVTFSVGLAMLSLEDKVLDDILQRADQALYAAKKLGRNRVEIKL